MPQDQDQNRDSRAARTGIDGIDDRAGERPGRNAPGDAHGRDVVVAVWRRLRKYQWRLVWLRQSKFMVTTTGLVRDDRGRVLLLRHRFWPVGRQVGLPGGYAVSGERLEDAVAREVHEETGLHVEVAHVVQVRSGFRLRVETAFAATLVPGGDPRLDAREILAAGFYELDDLPEDLMPNHRRLIQDNAAWFTPAG
ncbi:NUDIX domain-containing protein [Actinospica durhamensis]|uniref:NUDIX domain-containing protein n=1 Tax=Actinospica durhamensis TaxID=1508375 RepID=A0A941EL13_9ACTN|nr:NUDIX domain-containing protein [Actinospica durhamensis]MBR7833106.1 NUDIX domain-containing protein [Actinospica durhamensis]